MIAILGGTGDEGLGLAMRFCVAGKRVIIGSRAAERAAAAAATVREAVAGAQSAALELLRLPRGETATIRIDTSASRNGPSRTTVQVQRGSQQMPPVTLNVNSSAELRKTLVEIAQKLLA